MNAIIRLQQLRIGSLAPLGNSNVQSGIFKTPVDSALLKHSGLEADAHGDTRHHGGAEKAMHHYASDHYQWWANQLPAAAKGHCQPGAFGENLVTEGMTESTVCVGDVYRIGKAVVQVSQARQPCWRLNLRFGTADMSARVQASLKTGWYYRVLEQGLIQAGDDIVLIDRPQSGWPLTRLLSILYRDTLDYPALEAIAALPELAIGWRDIAQARILNRAVESWQKRLQNT